MLKFWVPIQSGKNRRFEVRRRLRNTAVVFLFFSLLVLCADLALAGKKQSEESLFKYLRVFSEAIHYIENNYVKDVKPRDLIYSAIKGMTSDLDPHSVFLTPDMYKEMRVETKGEFGGLGIEITIKDGVLTIVAPIEGTPAWRAGLKPGDKIIKINGKPTKGMTLMDAVKKLRGPRGTKVTITILREGVDKPFDVTIVRDIIKIKSVRYKWLDKKEKIGYIKIRSFQEKTTRELDNAFYKLYGEGLKALVLDLRNNPGGLLSQAVSVSDRFLKGGKLIVYVKGKGATDNLSFKSHDEGTYPYVPMVILVNAGSASASEIVTGALKAHKRAVVVGERTFGKGSVQTIFPLSDGSALKLTTAYYYTPDNICIEGKGIEPDFEVPENLVEKSPSHPVIREKELTKLKEGKSLPELENFKKKRQEKKVDYQLKFAEGFLKLWIEIGSRPHEEKAEAK